MKSITKFDNLFSFETERLIAKKVCGEDLDKLIVLHADPRIAKTLTGVLTIEQVREKIQQHIDHWESHGFGLWVFYLKSTGEWIGRGGLNQKLIEGKDIIEVAYALRPEFWQQGYATEIASAAIEIAFDILGYNEVYGFVLPDNIASQRVMQKVGLTYLRNSTCADMPCLLYRLQKQHTEGVTCDYK